MWYPYTTEKNGQNVATAFHYLFEAKRKQKVPCQTNSLSVLLTELNLLPSRKKKAELIFIQIHVPYSALS